MVLGHERFGAGLNDARDRLPAPLADLDTNRNGELAANELAGYPETDLIRDHDINGDGRVDAGELQSYVTPPRDLYKGRRSITIGGQTVTLLQPGPVFGRGDSLIHFETERVLFAGDLPDLGDGFTFGNRSPVQVVEWLAATAELDFETLVTGSGRRDARSDVLALRAYLDDLHRGVVAGYEQGRSATALAAGPLATNHSTVPAYHNRVQHVSDIRSRVRIVSLDLHGSGAYASSTTNPAFCPLSEHCGWQTNVPAATAGISLTLNRLVVQGEVTFEWQSIGASTSTYSSMVFAHRDTRATILAGYTPLRRNRITYSLMGGMTFIVGDTVSTAARRYSYTDADSGLVFHDRDVRRAWTGGIDLGVSLTPRWTAVVPFRLSRAAAPTTYYWPGSSSLQGGIGLRYRLARNAN